MDAQLEFLKRTAKYVWWKGQEEVLADPDYLLRQIMTLGTLADCIDLEKLFPRERLIKALQSTSPGQMNGRSWHFWHYRLFGPSAPVPPMPKRQLPDAGDFDVDLHSLS